MSLTTRVASHLPYLRRYARAVTGSQTSGDAYVAAVLEALIADVSIFPETSKDRVSLYKLFVAIFGSTSIEIRPIESPFAWEQRAAANLSSLPSMARHAFLLVSVEGFTIEETAEVLDVSVQKATELLDEASREISRRLRPTS